MCDSEFVLTYNPECLERHSDSSDFENYEPAQIRGRNHSILRRKLVRHTEMANYELEMRSKKHKPSYFKTECVYDNRILHPHQCTCKDCVIPVEEKRDYIAIKSRKVKYCNEGNDERHIQTAPSRLTAVRSKIIPCLSNIFRRTIHSNRDEIKKNKHFIVNSTKDNCCQVYCVNCNHKRFKKHRVKPSYAVQSFYNSYDRLNKTPDSGIVIGNITEKDTRTKDSGISCDFTPSSVSANIKADKKKLRKIIENEIKKACYKKHLAYHLRNQEQQFPSKPNIQAFLTPKTSKFKSMQSDLADMHSNLIPSNSSIFWEYLVERINKKYLNNNRSGLVKSCHCTNAQTCPNMNKDLKLKLELKSNEQATQDSQQCSCSTTPMSPLSPNASQPNPPTTIIRQESPPGTGKKKGSARAPKKVAAANTKVQCKCQDNTPPNLRVAKKDSPTSDSLTSSPGNTEIRRPCQEPHNEIKESLEKKYNGEILCIHNPPCILINGCLNLPPVKGQFSPSTWPVMQTTSFHAANPKLDGPKNEEQATQYEPTDFCNYQVVCVKTEKMTQSICNHDPPCEVVRCCYQPEFDLKLEHSCVHVPMCRKIPECITNDNDQLSKCEHQPRCTELPLCKRKPKKYIVLTAKDDVGTQVRPNMRQDCKHVPPCIMIPKCLGKLMCDGYVPHEAIPGCVHQPMCEMIPACCRKSAKMVSVCSQYPNTCRIV